MIRCLTVTGPQKRIFAACSAVIVGAAMLLSMSAFIADMYAAVAERALDDPGTEEKDIRDVSEETVSDYNRAVRALRWAGLLSPTSSEHPGSLSKLYVRLMVWREAMQTMGRGVPAGIAPGDELREAALDAAERAVALDPANPDHLLGLAQVHEATGDQDAAFALLSRAMASYPVNGPVRYLSALQMLRHDRVEEAREQARLLARYDDSYCLNENEPASAFIRAQRQTWYETRLVNSYLYKAMEIVWRVSAKDPKAVIAIVPDNADAKEVARRFFELKGMDPLIDEAPREPDSKN